MREREEYRSRKWEVVKEWGRSEAVRRGRRRRECGKGVSGR